MKRLITLLLLVLGVVAMTSIVAGAPVGPPEHERPPCYFIIDRIEGDWAVVEMDIGVTVDIPLRYVPPTAREGERLPALPPPPACEGAL